MKSFIQLNGMQFYAYHGVLLEERQQGNDFVVDIKMEVNIKKAIVSDNIEDTINYATIFQRIKEEMNIPSNLLEHVAGRIINRLALEFSTIDTIELTIRKKRPPVGGDTQEAAVTLIIHPKTIRNELYL